MGLIIQSSARPILISIRSLIFSVGVNGMERDIKIKLLNADDLSVFRLSEFAEIIASKRIGSLHILKFKFVLSCFMQKSRKIISLFLFCYPFAKELLLCWIFKSSKIKPSCLHVPEKPTNMSSTYMKQNKIYFSC